jgi:hypothetical protein
MLSFAYETTAAPVRLEFRGVWNDSTLINSSVRAGDVFTGVISYDPSRIAVIGHSTRITGEITEYRFPNGAASIQLSIHTANGVVMFRSDSSAMYGYVVNDFYDGAFPTYDRFLIQSFGTAKFPNDFKSSFERLSVDIADFDFSLLNSSGLPTTLGIPLNGNAMISIQGGSTVGNLDYYSAGMLDTISSASGSNR